MPIPDEAREALHAAVDAGWRTSWGDSYVDVDEFLVGLSERGYTVVKVTDLHQQGCVPIPSHYAIESAIREADDYHAKAMGKTGVRREHGVAALRSAEATAVLALLRGEGQ